MAARTAFDAMMASWGRESVPASPQWPSRIGNDHAPFEFSVAFVGTETRLRFLVEAQSTSPGFPAVRDACLAVQDAVTECGADPEAYQRVRDLFLTDVPQARFALWHAAAIAPGPSFVKAYLNPQIHGADHAETLVERAFERLGLRGAWPQVRDVFRDRVVPGSISPEGLRGNEIPYFAVDLLPAQRARSKVYLYPAGATARDFERLAALRPSYVPGEVTAFCRAMTGSTGPYTDHPLCAYVAFTGTDPTPSDVTIQIPMPAYVPDDREARDRIVEYFRTRGLPTASYLRALGAATRRPLTAGRGLHTYVSLRTGRTPAHVTTYFAAELYDVQAPRRDTASVRLAAAARVERFLGQV